MHPWCVLFVKFDDGLGGELQQSRKYYGDTCSFCFISRPDRPPLFVCVCVCVSLSLSLSISGAQVVCLVGCYQSFCCSFLSWLSVQGSWCTGISIARFWWKRKPKLWAWNWRRETDKSCQQELVFLVVQVLLPREIVLLLEERRSSADHERVSRISSLWQSPSFSR